MNRERVISVVLSDEDWKAFVEAQPQPVEWLRQRIRESIAPRQPDKRDNTTKH